jgi:hypothetical protein
MKFFARFAVFAALLSALQLRAQVLLAPIYENTPPAEHSYIISLGDTFTEATRSVKNRLVVYTTQETYSLPYIYTRESGESTFTTFPVLGYQKAWDLTPFNLNIFEESIAVRANQTANLVYFTGGLTGNRLIVFQQSPAAVLKNQVMGGLLWVPAGMAIRPPTETNSGGLFYSTRYGVGVDPYGPAENYVPALIYHPDLNNLPVTSLPTNTFGVGLVTTGVGALELGPDGRLNVIDTNLHRILRFDPTTFQHLDDIELGNSTTSGNSFAITTNGFVFTASTVTGSGSIYNYYTGALVGSYACTSYDENGFGGKTSMHATPDGLVFLYSDLTHAIHVFDSNELLEKPVFGMPTGTPGTGDFTLHINGLRGRVYSIEWAPTVNGPWTTLGSATAGLTGSASLIDAIDHGTAFYRTFYP